MLGALHESSPFRSLGSGKHLCDDIMCHSILDHQRAPYVGDKLSSYILKLCFSDLHPWAFELDRFATNGVNKQIRNASETNQQIAFVNQHFRKHVQ